MSLSQVQGGVSDINQAQTVGPGGQAYTRGYFKTLVVLRIFFRAIKEGGNVPEIAVLHTSWHTENR